MLTSARVLIGLVALLHAYFLVLEVFLWTKPRTYKAFGLTKDFAQATVKMAANQGVYNGFLSAGLIWSLLATELQVPLATFFLLCVVIAGIVGGATVNRRVFFVQAGPAIAALVALYFSQ